MIDRIGVLLDKFLLDYFWRVPFLSIENTWKYDFPTKRLIGHCLDNCFDRAEKEGKHALVESRLACIAHMYYYDSTVSKEHLDLIHAVYDTCTRERVRQLLCKFIRQYYRR